MSIFATGAFTIVCVVLTMVFSYVFVIGKDAYNQMKEEIQEEKESL
jgi:hypothetical protein